MYVCKLKRKQHFPWISQVILGSAVVDCKAARWTKSFLDASLVQSLLKTLLNPIEIGENVINAVKGHRSDVLPAELVDIGKSL